LEEAIENMRWNAINWDKLTGSGEGPFVPDGDSSKSLRDKWQVVNYAREALWQRELSSAEKTNRCALFSTSVTTDSGNVDLEALCVTAAAASTAPDNFWEAMEENCWGKWNSDYTTQTAAPVLGVDKCINSDNNTALNALTGNNPASIDIDWDGTADSVKRWEKWKLLDKGTEAVWNRNLDKTVRQNRCSNFSSDNSTSGTGDSAFNTVTTSLKDLCLSAVNSDSAIISFDDAMTALTEGPFVNWGLAFDNGTERIPVSGTQPWEKTYKLILSDGTAVQYPSTSHWANDSRATDNTTFPGKWAVAGYLQEVMRNTYNSEWNTNGLTASDISPRCQFFTATDNISSYCSLMPTYIEAKSVMDNRSRLWSSNIPFYINTNDSRIIKRSSNGYLFDDPDSTLTLYTRVFPKETFNGSTTWSSSTIFNANQAFALLFTFMEGRSQIPIPSNPIYGDLDNLTTNEKAWLNWDVFSTSFMGEEKDMMIPLLNALDNPSALR
jgi:hypothetical protein